MMTQEGPKTFSVLPLAIEEVRVPLVNKDAEFLIQLAVEMDDGDMPDETTVRLRKIAENLARLDARVQALSSGELADAYAKGVIEGQRRQLLRSNLPDVVKSELHSPELRRAIAAHPVTRIERDRPKAPAKPTTLALAGIKLNLNLKG